MANTTSSATTTGAAKGSTFKAYAGNLIGGIVEGAARGLGVSDGGIGQAIKTATTPRVSYVSSPSGTQTPMPSSMRMMVQEQLKLPPPEEIEQATRDLENDPKLPEDGSINTAYNRLHDHVQEGFVAITDVIQHNFHLVEQRLTEQSRAINIINTEQQKTKRSLEDLEQRFGRFERGGLQSRGNDPFKFGNGISEKSWKSSPNNGGGIIEALENLGEGALAGWIARKLWPTMLRSVPWLAAGAALGAAAWFGEKGRSELNALPKATWGDKLDSLGWGTSPSVQEYNRRRSSLQSHNRRRDALGLSSGPLSGNIDDRRGQAPYTGSGEGSGKPLFFQGGAPNEKGPIQLNADQAIISGKTTEIKSDRTEIKGSTLTISADKVKLSDSAKRSLLEQLGLGNLHMPSLASVLSGMSGGATSAVSGLSTMGNQASGGATGDVLSNQVNPQSDSFFGKFGQAFADIGKTIGGGITNGFTDHPNHAIGGFNSGMARRPDGMGGYANAPGSTYVWRPGGGGGGGGRTTWSGGSRPSGGGYGGGGIGINPNTPINVPAGTPGTTATLMSQRAQFRDMLNNPQTRELAMGLMVAENNGSAQGRMSVLETALNRGVSHGFNNSNQIFSSAYYAPFHDGGLQRALGQLRSNPQLRAQVNAEVDQVLGGSNWSNFGTQNGSAGVAASAARDQTVTARWTGETYSRKDNPIGTAHHGAGTIRMEGGWYQNTQRQIQDWDRQHPQNNTTPQGQPSVPQNNTTPQGQPSVPQNTTPASPTSQNNGPTVAIPSGRLTSKQLENFVAHHEAFEPKPFSDFGQTNIGYGTSARPGETSISEPEARQRMVSELDKHMAKVHEMNPKLDQGTKNALASLSYNIGDNWMTLKNQDGSKTLGDYVRDGNIQGIKEKIVQYNKAGGKVLSGLTKRRNDESQMIGNPRWGDVTGSDVGKDWGRAENQGVPGQPTHTQQDPSKPYPAGQTSQVPIGQPPRAGTPPTPGRSSPDGGGNQSHIGNLAKADEFLYQAYNRSSHTDSGGPYGWKDVQASQRYGMSLKEYAIQGMDPRMRMALYEQGQTYEKATGQPFTLNTGFRDDYRQSIATGKVVAAPGGSTHGGSRVVGDPNSPYAQKFGQQMSGYGHGQAADFDEGFPQWVARQGPDTGIGYTGRHFGDAPHVSFSGSYEARKVGEGFSPQGGARFGQRFNQFMGDQGGAQSAQAAGGKKTMIFFSGIDGRIDKEAAQAFAKQQGAEAKIFAFNDTASAAQYLKQNPGPYSVMGFSQGASATTLERFEKDAIRAGVPMPERVDTTGLSDKSPQYKRPAGVVGVDFIDHSGGAHAGQTNVVDMRPRLPATGFHDTPGTGILAQLTREGASSNPSSPSGGAPSSGNVPSSGDTQTHYNEGWEKNSIGKKGWEPSPSPMPDWYKNQGGDTAKDYNNRRDAWRNARTPPPGDVGPPAMPGKYSGPNAEGQQGAPILNQDSKYGGANKFGGKPPARDIPAPSKETLSGPVTNPEGSAPEGWHKTDTTQQPNVKQKWADVDKGAAEGKSGANRVKPHGGASVRDRATHKSGKPKETPQGGGRKETSGGGKQHGSGHPSTGGRGSAPGNIGGAPVNHPESGGGFPGSDGIGMEKINGDYDKGGLCMV